MSGRFRRALTSVPQTKPSWTAIVNQLTLASLKFHSTRRAGTTAEALNQSDMPSSSASESNASARQRAWDTSFVFSIADLSPDSMIGRKGYYKLQNSDSLNDPGVLTDRIMEASMVDSTSTT